MALDVAARWSWVVPGWSPVPTWLMGWQKKSWENAAMRCRGEQRLKLRLMIYSAVSIQIDSLRLAVNEV